MASLASTFKEGHNWCFLVPASDKTWWNGNPNDNETISHCRWLTYSSVTLHIQYSQRQIHYRLDNCGMKEEMTTSRSHLRTRRFSSIPYWQAIYCVFTIAFTGGMISSRESREADSQSFRTFGFCQNDRKISVLCHQKGNWIDAQSFYRQTQTRVLCGPRRNDYSRPQSRGRNQSRSVVFQSETVALEGTQTPHGQLFQL